MSDWRKYLTEPRIAYFSMEIGISNDIPTFSGGLGVLAGDTIKSAADLKLPIVAITLIYRMGYFNQSLNAKGWQIEAPRPWRPEQYMTLLPIKTLVTIDGRDVKIQAWVYRVKSPTGGEIPVLFLDTDIPGNQEEDRHLTDYLYGGDKNYRLKQEIVLGIGGARILDVLGFTIRKYHMNEGHAALLTLELLNRPKHPLEEDWDDRVYRAAERCVFTTHTPVEAGHDRFPYPVVEQILGEVIPYPQLKKMAGADEMNMTMLALNLSSYVNGVAKKHGEVSKSLFPGFQIHAITNGVHPFTWTSLYFVDLFDRYLPGWANEPELLVRVETIPDEEIWEAHAGAKAYLFQYIEESTGVRLDPDVLTIGFARRAAAYKRGDLIFSDINRILEIGKGKIQLVFGGKAHPQDNLGKEVIQRIVQHIESLRGEINAVYLQNYNMEVAARLIPGVDLWLNNPLRPLEASGTSGMKATLNGVPNFSVLDGWWIEGHMEGITGWAIGPPPSGTDADPNSSATDVIDLYEKLEKTIVPLYYNNRAGWIRVMKNAISMNASYFNTHVMMRRYVTEAYLR